MMRKCQFINKKRDTYSLKVGEYYTYKIYNSPKDDTNSFYLAFPYHIYDKGNLIATFSKEYFFSSFVDIAKQRKDKLKKIYENRR